MEVFVHGGGSTAGSPNIYDGRKLAAAHQAIVVIPAYRTGVLGGLATPSLTAESADGSSGNYGLLDQQAALRWVQRNASAFGGDRHEVSLVGQSAGDSAVCHYLASPTAAGLFSSAAIWSSPHCGARELPAAEATGSRVAAALGCTTTACLRDLPAGKLLDTAQTVSGGNTGTPAAGGRGLPLGPQKAIAVGRINEVPVAIGATTDDWRGFALGSYPLSAAEYEKQLTEAAGPEHAEQALDTYPLGNFERNEYALGTYETDQVICHGLATAADLSRTTATYAYEFGDVNAPSWQSLGPPMPNPSGYVAGASHTTDIQYVFATRPPPALPSSARL
ncbi:carboxylesterase family protein [Streptomyces sp. A1499]|uniref:carboxylesterase family protein n=1 Tax=Streptomyces sp. A1499 TaxID=2563104 RepID=UPI00109EB5FE|nr:carboxylesterase family protein [Streptomyces sp. A1499]THC40444.1 hypothetical protein E7X58_37650 [Streptomyces sp. A1499]